MIRYLALLIAVLFLLGIISTRVTLPLPAAAAFFILLIIFWIVFFKYQKSMPGKGFFSLLLTLSTFFICDGLLKSMPEGVLPNEATKAPPLVLPDRGLNVYEKNGFRGKRPCMDCPDKPIRIVTMGGSSTYGLPLFYSEDTYSARLQRLLDERRPGEKYEVLNGGIPGYGIMQVIVSLEQEVLKYKPDIVTVCAWYNDSSVIPSWYGFSDRSDLESYNTIKVLNAVQKIPGFKGIYGSHLFAFIRYYLIELINYPAKSADKPQIKKSKKLPIKRRMSPEEFEWGLEQIQKLSIKHNFLPVIVYEPVNRTPEVESAVTGRKYYEVMSKFTKKYELPLADTLKDFAKKRREWLYYDVIHPNKAGHTLIADSIYNTIFKQPLPLKAKALLTAAGIDLKMPEVQNEYFYQLESSKIQDKILKFSASTPFSELKKTLLMFINSKKVLKFPDVSNTSKEFTFSIPSEFLEFPLVNLEFKIDASSIKYFNPIGLTGIHSPSYIKAVSGGKGNGWQQSIEVDGIKYTGDYDGYSVVVLGALSGSVKDSRRFNFSSKNGNTASFHQYISKISTFNEDGAAPIVIITLKADGYLNSDQKLLSDTFRLLGGTGQTPQKHESFILIGTPGAQPGQAVELKANKLLAHEIGKASDTSHKLVNISDNFKFGLASD